MRASHPNCKSWLWIPLLALMLVSTTTIARGQAWVPERREGTFTTSFSYLSSEGHLGNVGQKEPEAAALSQSALFEVEYGLTDKLAISASLPVISIRYNSNNPPPAFLKGLFDQAKQSIPAGSYNHGFLDDGSYHSSLQDFYIDARYNVSMRPLVFTPFVGLLIPSRDYAYVGEASPGRNLKEFRFGANVARRLDPFLRRGYAQSQIGFAIPEKAMNIRTNRMNIISEFGYNFGRRFAARGVGSWQHTFNGITSLAELTSPLLELTHERLLKANYWHVGGGFSYAVNSKTEISADYIAMVSGQVTHYGKGFSIGVSRSFNFRQRNPAPPPTLSQLTRQERNEPSAPDSLIH
jgi:hypothetical protein